MPKYYQLPFASSGDRASVPTPSQMDGTVSYTDGYGVDYSLPLDTDPLALAPERDKWNQLWYDITQNMQQYQQHGFPEFITSGDNGGSPYAYAQGAGCRNGGVNYICTSPGNTNTPPGVGWVVFDGVNITGNAATATALQTARAIGGVNFDGTAAITPQQIQPASEAADTTCFLAFFNAASGTAQQPKYNSGLGYNAATNAITATTFIGALTGNASTATALQTARNIGNVSFDGTAAIVPQTIQTVDDSADTTCFIAFFNASGTQTGGQQPKTNSGLTYNASTNAFAATTLGGTLSTAAQPNITSVGTLTGGATGAGFTVALTTSTITGLLTGTNGGTNNAFMQFSGPASSTKTFTLPNATCSILTTNAAVTEAQGGTNQTTYTQGDMLYASAANTLGKLGIGAVGQRIGTNGTIPQWEYDYIPQNSQSAAYTTVASDAGKHIFHPSADTSARTWTIAANASVPYVIGTVITFVNQTGAGVVTIAINSDTMWLAGAGTTGNRTLAANGIATAIKVTSTGWLISGTGLT